MDVSPEGLNWCLNPSEGVQQLQRIITLIINLIKIVIPIALVILGMLDLGKAVMSQKEDDIKKGQSTFIKRLIAAVVMFLIVFVVQLVMGYFIPGGNDLADCVNKFVNGPGAVNTDDEDNQDDNDPAN